MYDLFVLGFLIIMVLFIGYNFYIDYSDWSNTGNSFAEGMASGQVIININSPKTIHKVLIKRSFEMLKIK